MAALQCEVCGSGKATRRKVEFRDFTGEFDICKDCYRGTGEFFFQGDTRTEICSDMRLSPLVWNGPKRCYMCNVRGDNDNNIELEVCMRCHRKVCYYHGLTHVFKMLPTSKKISMVRKNWQNPNDLSTHGCFVTFGEDQEYNIPEGMRKVLPFEHQTSEELILCLHCVDEVIDSTVHQIKEDDLILCVGAQPIFGYNVLDALTALEKRLRGDK